MNNRFKKSAAFIMATVLAFGSCITALADGGSAVGTGSSTQHLYADDVVKAMVPTESEMSKYFNFVVDPERLINSAGAIYSDSGAYDATFAKTNAAVGNDAGIYFYRNEDGDLTDSGKADNYLSTSTNGAITIKNYKDVDVSFRIDVSTPGGFTLTDSAVHANVESEDPLLYLGFVTKNADAAAETTVITGSVVIEDTFAGQPGNYNIASVKSNGSLYSAVEKTGDNITWKKYEFQMTGAVSKTTVTNELKAPILTYTWNIDIHQDGPSVTFGDDGLISIRGLTADQNFAHKAILSYSGGSYDLNSDRNIDWIIDEWSEEDGGNLGFQLKAAWLTALAGKDATIEVYLTDETTITASQTF